ncbi:MAG: outer membrane protein transport protein [Leptospirales bacterium]|nr:outer membrane protein transport protein [Leptospirales bacterium]
MKAIRWLTIALLPLALVELSADPLHNVENLFGERAPGMGGAFVAISDDPSGALYNPAGLAFIYNDYLSISASNYRSSKKSYLNALGPGQNYHRNYENYFPNFFGAVRDFGEVQLAFVLANPRGEAYDQSDRIQSPLVLLSLGQINLEYSETNTALQLGPAMSWRINDRLAIGISALLHDERSRIAESVTAEGRNGGIFTRGRLLRSSVRGALPILGVQWMPADSFSFGLSVRKLFITSAERSQSGQSITAVQGQGYSATFLESDEDDISWAYGGSTILAAPNLVATIPNPPEIRGGVAWFPNSRVLCSMDVIYTDGFSLQRDRTAAASVSGANALVLRDREETDQYRDNTANIAAGAEFFLNDQFSVRFGYFTNKANSKDIKFNEVVLSEVLRSIYSSGIVVLGPGLLYQPVLLEDPAERSEHIDLQAYTLGFGLADANSSISVNAVYEFGSGGARATIGPGSGRAEQKNLSIYLVASLRR